MSNSDPRSSEAFKFGLPPSTVPTIKFDGKTINKNYGQVISAISIALLVNGQSGYVLSLAGQMS